MEEDGLTDGIAIFGKDFPVVTTDCSAAAAFHLTLQAECVCTADISNDLKAPCGNQNFTKPRVCIRLPVNEGHH